MSKPLNFGPYGKGMNFEQYSLNAFNRIEKWSYDIVTRFDVDIVTGINTLVGSGAISLTTHTTLWDTTGGGAATLADGTQGQEKHVIMTVDAGNGVLTPANLAAGTTITFDAVGDAIELKFLGTEWFVISNNNAVVA